VKLDAAPGDTELFFDFDGTLAAICDDPAQASMSDVMFTLLAELIPTFGRVSVVSGRPVSFLVERVPPTVALYGLYGLEWAVDGQRGEVEGVAGWRDVVTAVAADGRRRFGPDVVEDKGASLTAHYRRNPELEADLVRWVEASAEASGLVMRSAKKSCELHPPVDIDKGTVVRERTGSNTAVVYVGDDIGDLPAFEAIAELADAGREAQGVVVRSHETPLELLDLADVVVDGIRGVEALLESLARGSQLVS
jgi:trehalose 6-phosphate phosphatase